VVSELAAELAPKKAAKVSKPKSIEKEADE
jgi:hypothetical protein